MNGNIIRYLVGQVLKMEAALFLLPMIIAVIYREPEGFAYLFVAAICLVIGLIFTIKKPVNTVFYLKEGCVITALSWIVLSIMGCLPFVLTGEIPAFHDALFETISGFTTTGSSILTDVEALSYTSLMWRSFTHWVGGMGVLVFLLAIVPLSGGSNVNLMKAESPGPSVEKLVPRVKSSAMILYLIYGFITLLEFLFLVFGEMNWYEALNTALATAGTGGFGIKADSIGGYSFYTQWIVTIFMILFGVNFNAYYLVALGKFKKIFAIEEVRTYVLIILAAVVVISINIWNLVGDGFTAVTQAAFQVGSIITTTGFATADFDLWPDLSKTILVILMFVGACAGSTGGGIKVSRILIMIKSVKNEVNIYLHPKSVKKVKMDGKILDRDIVRSTTVYIGTFILIFVVSLILISWENQGLLTSFTAVAATINNIGPGLEKVGPTQNFAGFSVFSKYVLMFDMLAGRLELFPLIILFQPSIWKDLITKQEKARLFSKKTR